MDIERRDKKEVDEEENPKLTQTQKVEDIYLDRWLIDSNTSDNNPADQTTRKKKMLSFIVNYCEFYSSKCMLIIYEIQDLRSHYVSTQYCCFRMLPNNSTKRKELERNT